MKKLISSTLAVTMLVTPLMGSACFADTAQEPNVHYVQNENRSEPFKEKKCDSQKTRKILAGVTAGTIALTGVTAATLKHFEDKLPESLKVKFPFLFTKKAQETQENIKTEKIPETVTETETTKDETIETAVTESEVSKNQTVETVTADSNITKNETIKTVAAELNITKKETTGSVAVNSNTTKNETVDIEAIKAKIIQSLAKNNTTNDADDTNWLNTLKNTAENVWNSAKDSFSATPTQIKYAIGCAALTPLFLLGGYKARKAINNFLAERKAAARAMKAAPALNALKEQFTPIAAEAAAKAAAAEAAAAEAAAVTRATEAVSALKALEEQFTPIAAEAAAKAAAKAAIIAEEKTFMDTMGNVADFFIKEAADAAAVAPTVVAAGAPVADAAATVVSSLTSTDGDQLLAKMSDGSYSLFGRIIKPGAMRQILSAKSKDGLYNTISNMAPRAASKAKNNLATIIFPKIVEGNFERSLNNLFP